MILKLKSSSGGDCRMFPSISPGAQVSKRYAIVLLPVHLLEVNTRLILNMSEYVLFSWHYACVGLNNDGAESLRCHWFLTVWELLEVRLLSELYTQGNHLCHFLHQRSVVRSCLKISSPSNLLQTKLCSPLLFGYGAQADPTRALCHSHNKNTPEEWSCKSRGNPLPWTTHLLQYELCWALIQQMVWRDNLQNHRDKYLIWMSTLKITHFSPQIICVLQREQRGSSPL